MSRGRFSTMVVAALVLAVAAGCDEARDTAEQSFMPVTQGVLTVATALPAPGFWTGDTAASVEAGFEYTIAAELAERFGLELDIVDVAFADLVAGDLGGADLALAQITVTDERATMLDFSYPYYHDQIGVVMRRGEEMADLLTAQDATWAVAESTVEADVLAESIRPTAASLLVDETDAAIEAVASGKVDAALLDLSSALAVTNGRRDLSTVARLTVAQQFAAALPLDSPNRDVVDAALRSLESSGRLDELADEFLLPLFETDPDTLPVIRTAR